MSSEDGTIIITLTTELCLSCAIFASTATAWTFWSFRLCKTNGNATKETSAAQQKPQQQSGVFRINSKDYCEQQQNQLLMLEDPYVQRRLSDRLSYHNLSDSNDASSNDEDDDDELLRCQDNWDHFEREGEEYGTHSDQFPTASATKRRPSSRRDPHRIPPRRHRRMRTTTSTSNSSSATRHSRNAARQRYNTRIMPQTVLLLRHGQSMGNVNEALYATTPDNAMPLTKLGWEQARAAGRQLKSTVFNSNNQMLQKRPRRIHFIVSPYVRTLETLHGILAAWVDPDSIPDSGDDDDTNNNDRLQAWYAALQAQGLSWHEDPRIREQDFGNYQDPHQMRQAKADRHRFGAFYYRFPHGESASDVFDRVSTFLDSLWRSFDVHTCPQYVLVTHGISIRILLARYYRYSIDQFHLLANPRNCECIELQHDGRGKLVLAGRYELEHEETGDGDGAVRVVGYQHHRRLRVLRDPRVRSVRMSYTKDTACVL